MPPRRRIGKKPSKKIKQEKSCTTINNNSASNFLQEDNNDNSNKNIDNSSKISDIDLPEESSLNIQTDTDQNITSSSAMVLDETTGLFVPVENIPIDFVEDIDESGFVKMRLDEKTGLFVEDSEKSMSSRKSLTTDSSVLGNQNNLSQNNNPEDSNYNPQANKILNEYSGILTRKRARKDKGNKDEYDRNKAKKAREEGRSYYTLSTDKRNNTKSYKFRHQRKLKPGCTSRKCAKSNVSKCNEIDENSRSKLFHSFWNDMDWEQRRVYVVSLIIKKEIVRSDENIKSRRNVSLKYHLKVNNKQLPVCKKMFLSTLGLGEWQVLNWIKKGTENGIVKKAKPNKTKNNTKKANQTKLLHVHNFLNKLPKLEAHYSRKSSTKLYLQTTYKSAQDVYRDFENYAKTIDLGKNEIPSYEFFRKQMMAMDINIFLPRKDYSDICFSYKNKNIPEEQYSSHLNEKTRARDEKESDKLSAIAGKVKAFTVDVQAVQMIPDLPAGSLYFKQKLKCHQFTIYNIANGDVICYVWHEGEGGVDGNVFASCLVDFLSTEIDLSVPIIIYSDGCSAQNRNVTIANALLQFANERNITIYQKYLVKGHTQMECDSVHSAIERRKKYCEIYVPANFVQIIKDARIKNPYKTKYLDYQFFKKYADVKMYKSIRPGNKAGSPTVLQIRGLKYSKEGLQYQLSFDDPWQPIPQRINTSFFETLPEPLYLKPLPVTNQKYRDLQSLKSLLPKDYQSFYDNLAYAEQ